MKTSWLAAAATCALLAAVPALAQGPAKTPAVSPAAGLAKAPRMGTWGFDLSGRDTATSPGQDFFQYANGAYEQKLVIPGDRVSYGAFDALAVLSQDRLHVLLDKAAADKAATGDQAKVGALYRSFMDEAKVQALGGKPMAADLAAIRAEKTKADAARAMGKSQHVFGGSVFGASVQVDGKDPDHYAVYLNQAGLNLPDRDYYLEASFAKQKTAYEAYVARMLGLMKWPNPAASAKAVVAFETDIARASWTKVDQRDDNKMYNPSETAKLAALAPGSPRSTAWWCRRRPPSRRSPRSTPRRRSPPSRPGRPSASPTRPRPTSPSPSSTPASTSAARR